jgi:hypothetical protein
MNAGEPKWGTNVDAVVFKMLDFTSCDWREIEDAEGEQRMDF